MSLPTTRRDVTPRDGTSRSTASREPNSRDLPSRDLQPQDQGLTPSQRLRRSADFLRCYRRGRKHHGQLATLHVHRNEHGETRLGITASRKVGKAVVRHRTKRRVREIFRRFEDRRLLPEFDVVVHLKPTAGRADFGSLEHEVRRLLRRLIDGRDGVRRENARRGEAKNSRRSSVGPRDRQRRATGRTPGKVADP